MARWVLDEWRASAEALHARPMPSDRRRRISWLHPSGAAVILGSSSPDPFEGRRTDVVRRRSGGGLVWLDPQNCTWMDVFVPAGDPLWCSDVGQSFEWLGRRLADAVSSSVSSPVSAAATAASQTADCALSVHRGAYEAGPAGGLVCFASRGPGEVLANGRKLIGISQRRTREGSRFQCLWYERFELGPIESVLDARTLSQVRERAIGWADLGPSATGARLADLVIEHLVADNPLTL